MDLERGDSEREPLLRSRTGSASAAFSLSTPPALAQMVHIFSPSSYHMTCAYVCLGFKNQYNRTYRGYSGQTDKDCSAP
jgi:hypothetical protein